MAKNKTMTVAGQFPVLGRILYFLVGFIGALTIFSVAFPPHVQGFTVLDLWRFFVSPGIVALIAATIGARAGARSHIRASEEDLAKMYWSLLDLAEKDLRINLAIMRKAREKFDEIRAAGRKPVFFELEPNSVHTIFLDDIEYPKLRKIVPDECTGDIFRVRNMKYVFDKWNMLVARFYSLDKPLVHDEAEAEIIRHLMTETAEENFIASCEQAVESIERIKKEISL